MILLSFLLSGIGAFLLIRYLTDDLFAAVIGGFIYAFNPSHFAHSLRHIELASIQFIPFFVLYFTKSLRHNSGKDLFLAGLFFLLNGIVSLHYFVLGIYFAGFSYVYLALARKKLFLPDFFKKISLIILPATLILCIFWAGRINSYFTGSLPREAIGYPGLINIALIILAFKGIIRKTMKYFLGAFLFFILTMGVHWHILGWLGIFTPLGAIAYVYLFFALIVSFAIKYFYQAYNFKLVGKNFVFSILALLLFCDYYSVCMEMVKRGF